MKSFHNLCRVASWSVVGLALMLGGSSRQSFAQAPFCNPNLNVFVQCENGATPGGTVSFFCNVVNTGNRPLTNVVVQDSQGGAVTNVSFFPPGANIPIFANYIPDPCGTVSNTFTATGTAICPPSNVVVSASASSVCSTPCPFDSSCQIQLAAFVRATNCVPAGTTVFASVIIGDDVSGTCTIHVQGSIVTNIVLSGARTNFVGSFTCDGAGTNIIIATVSCAGLDGEDFIRAVCTNQFVCCSAEPGLEVTKEITCMGLLGGSTCAGGKTATGAATDTQCPSFCYTVVLKNTGNVPLHNNQVVDTVYGSLNFPLVLLPGQVVTGGFLAAHCSNVVNTVTATAFTPEGLPVEASDSAVAQIVQASLTCDAILTSTNDVDGDLSGNDHHVSLPLGPLFDVQVGVTLTAGDVDVVVTNVFIGFYDSNCYITNFISLPAHTSTNLSGCSFLHRCFSVYSTNIYVQASGYVNPAGGICSLDENGSDIQVSTECSAVLECVPGCPTCEFNDNGGGPATVVVDAPGASVNFNTKPPTYSGDPDLLPYFTFDTNGPTADTWKAIFDVGAKKLLVKSGATITTKQVPLGTNNRRAPGLVIRSTCALETEPGSYITVGSLNRQAGDILIQVGGDIAINGVVSNSVEGTRGRPGNITIASDCGSITTGGGSRVITYGQDFGGSDINIASCQHGDIDIRGLVDASYKSATPSTIRIAAFDGSVIIVGTNKFGTEVVAGTKRTITSGVSVRSRRDPIPGTILIQAEDTINVFGSTLLSKFYPNYGAVAVKTMSNSSKGGLIDARALTGRILSFDRAFDDANRYNTTAKISLQAGDEIKLKVSASINDGASDNTKAAVSTQAGDTGKGGTNLLRAGFIIVDSKAQVLADFAGRPGAVGTNIISGCTSVSLPAGGEISPPDDSGDNVGTCGGPDPLFMDCSELGVTFGQIQ